MVVKRLCLMLLLPLLACAHHHYVAPPPAAASIVLLIPRRCLIEVKLRNDSYCQGADARHMSCHNLTMVYKPTCSLWEVR